MSEVKVQHQPRANPALTLLVEWLGYSTHRRYQRMMKRQSQEEGAPVSRGHAPGCSAHSPAGWGLPCLLVRSSTRLRSCWDTDPWQSSSQPSSGAAEGLDELRWSLSPSPVLDRFLALGSQRSNDQCRHGCPEAGGSGWPCCLQHLCYIGIKALSR